MYHHCILCGVRIQPQPDPPERELIWRSKIRAVRSEQGRSLVFLTGIGYLSQDCLRASHNPDVFYADSPRDLKSYDLRYSDSNKSRTFIFHESCWQILLSQLESLTDQPKEPRQIAGILFDLLFCLPRDRFHVSFPAHDFGGALEICSSPQGLPQRWKFLLADPNAFRTYLLSDGLDAIPDLFQSCSGDTQDFFSQSPLEVNHLIFNFLPSQDLCNLRLSSRKIASIAKPTLLPQSFWASRFAIDKEMNFFALQEYLSEPQNSRNDWQLLYVRIRRTLRDKAVTGHLRNQRQVWKCACKFVSLQLLDLCIDSSSLKPGFLDMTHNRPWFWHPAKPNQRGTSTFLEMPNVKLQRSISTLALNMNFGGTDGSRLSRLNRIVAFHDDCGGHFRGFAFFYKDGSGEAFGMKEIINTANKRWTCLEQSIAVDGPGGERIVKLGLMRGKNELGDHPQVIKMYTNHGRTLEFRRWHRCRLGDQRFTREEHLFCDPEGIITGILATAQLSTGNLQSLGLRCRADLPSNASINLKSRQQPNQHPRTFPMSEVHWNNTPRAYSCFTSVVLSKLRRVGVSAGIHGRTRGPDHISGLCFEFWDSEVPVYVGQWFQQVGTLSLEPDERITSFTFWQAQESHPSNDKGENNGRITGVQIRTIGSGKKQGGIRVGGGKDMLVYSFAENSYEKLRGLAWNFYHQCDYIYDFTQPRPGTVLRLHDIAESSHNSRMPGKIFWQIRDHDGNWLYVSCIHAFSNNHQLSGFIFEYGKTGIYKKVGHVEGDSASRGLKAGERITQMVVKTRPEGIYSITFWTNENGWHWLYGGRESLKAPPGDTQDYLFGEPHDAEKLGTPSSGQTAATLPGKDGESCVGIWLTMKIFPSATDLVDKVGPIFEKKL
ncbi:hypothetical protein CEP54_012455 [Fusarium duplospermum]|uniref:F-box domain-containing protein n=1 Tax=Fusarium duplospermum TaxID=1325734 RepID=A0A428P8Y5_9HYPO|nr:hypothetical protein CEP54_012455 [Fusarium duplospermum]